jgi:peroxiredoxin Q/BCP
MKTHNFSLPDQNGKLSWLENYKGKWGCIYLKDDTGCTKEACGFRDFAKEYSDKGITILGVSKRFSSFP